MVSASTTSSAPRVASLMAGPQLEARLRQRRSKPYLEAMTRLRVNAHQPDRTALASLLTLIGKEFEDLAVEQRPYAIMGQVTSLDSAGQYHPTTTVAIWNLSSRRWDQPYGFDFLIEDAQAVYKREEPMPNELLERARTLALHRGYLGVELYADTIRAITTDGSVSVTGK